MHRLVNNYHVQQPGSRPKFVAVGCVIQWTMERYFMVPSPITATTSFYWDIERLKMDWGWMDGSMMKKKFNYKYNQFRDDIM